MAQAIESELPPEDEPRDAATPVPPAADHGHEAPHDEPPPAEPSAPAEPPADDFVMSARDDDPPPPEAPEVEPEPAPPVDDANAWRRARGGGPGSAPADPPPAAPAWTVRPVAEVVNSGDKALPAVVYVLFLAGFLSVGLTSLVGAVIAHVKREEAPDWIRSHYVFQIRTFWIGLAATLLGALTFFFAIGPFIWMAAGLWTAIRCAMGLNWLLKDRPYPNPQTWTV